jgi:hypothetical protein
MIERREQLGLALEARQAIGIAGDLGRKNLQRRVTLQLRVAGPVNFSHSPGADQREDFVRAQP